MVNKRISIIYTTKNGTKESAHFEEDVTEINLEKHEIISIDLTPLTSCKNLQLLHLGENPLQSLDLSPLSSCINLQHLYLGCRRVRPSQLSKIQSIDLTPLSSCINLQTFGFGSEVIIQKLDLSPLRTCINLKVVQIYVNSPEIQGTSKFPLDISPLSSCPQLKKLVLNGTQIESLDLAPLAACTNLESISIDNTQLQSIDLSPLISCTKIEIFSLFRNQLQSLDLTPLSSWTNLQAMSLTDSKIKSINLTPLSSCTSLISLDLTDHQLQSIDLTPLSSCIKLEYLDLSSNQLQTINLSPLSSCTSLIWISLGENQLQSINLEILDHLIVLEELGLSGNQIQEFDLTPLASRAGSTSNEIGIHFYRNPCKSIDITPLSESITLYLEGPIDIKKLSFAERMECLSKSKTYTSWLEYLLSDPKIIFGEKDGEEWGLKDYWVATVYRRPRGRYPWSFLYQVAEKYGEDRRVQHDILHALGLDGYGFIDADLRSRFLSIPQNTPTETVCKQIANVLVEEIIASVDRGGTTTGLRLEELLQLHGEIVKIADQIIELRQKEIQKVQIAVVERGGWDLSPLWLTAYGHEILSETDIRLIADDTDIELIRDSLSKVGFQLKTGDSTVATVAASTELIKTILWIVHNKNPGLYKYPGLFRRKIWEEVPDDYIQNLLSSR